MTQQHTVATIYKTLTPYEELEEIQAGFKVYRRMYAGCMQMLCSYTKTQALRDSGFHGDLDQPLECWGVKVPHPQAQFILTQRRVGGHRRWEGEPWELLPAPFSFPAIQKMKCFVCISESDLPASLGRMYNTQYSCGGPPGGLPLKEEQLFPSWLNLALSPCIDMCRAGWAASFSFQLGWLWS